MDEDKVMKKPFKNVRIETDKGEMIVVSRQRFDNLLQTLDMLASGDHRRDRRQRPSDKSFAARN
jgi:hypothetical protein